ncbi:hypothetical protein FDI24_gp218 [Acidovorax phage ACP17]|uniref:Uncharacterized protein n=1 Tax=Acidovorax phage ACP17 TaxID=2010329 RepID=A0A218M390_9CAUD|nr:hypothetical protein FDI24_gp218 [Acidovorax phage ACP17]ASD50499.1 hypothetical protein [Acidovorax phage ACP17]
MASKKTYLVKVTNERDYSGRLTAVVITAYDRFNAKNSVAEGRLETTEHAPVIAPDLIAEVVADFQAGRFPEEIFHADPETV